MADPANPPGERRLSHPPSDRYRTTESDPAPEPVPPMSRRRALPLGVAAGLAGALLITILGGVLTVTAGLIVIAAATGWAIGVVARGSIRTAVLVAIVAVAAGQAGLWVYARTEGGVLGPLDFLWQVYGGLVLLELLAATIGAWVAAR